MSEELKPCPFCGSEADIAKGTYDVRPYWAYCMNGHGNGYHGDTPDEVAREWNRRTVDVDELREVVKELECCYVADDWSNSSKDIEAVKELCDNVNEFMADTANRISKAAGL